MSGFFVGLISASAPAQRIVNQGSKTGTLEFRRRNGDAKRERLVEKIRAE